MQDSPGHCWKVLVNSFTSFAKWKSDRFYKPRNVVGLFCTLSKSHLKAYVLGGSSILMGTKTSEGEREGHLERRACGNDPGIPCEASWPPQGRTLGGHHSHLEQEGSQVLSDCAKCLLCPFRLSLSDQLVAPRSGNHVKALTYHITS